eukprot:scaffold16407_cov18-Tisochrysis_lutea.AAC.2
MAHMKPNRLSIDCLLSPQMRNVAMCRNRSAGVKQQCPKHTKASSYSSSWKKHAVKHVQEVAFNQVRQSTEKQQCTGTRQCTSAPQRTKMPPPAALPENEARTCTVTGARLQTGNMAERKPRRQQGFERVNKRKKAAMAVS